MALSMGADPRLTSVLRAIGLLDAAGQIDPQWFDHPIESLGRCLSDPGQRSAVLALLGDALPPEPGPWQADGSSWHPVLAANPVGNVYLTVSGTVLGLAARAKGPWTGTPGVDLAVRLPLVDADGDAVRAVAATEDGPLEVALRVTLGAGIIPEAIEVRVAVDAANGVRVRVILEQSGQPPAVLDPAHLDRGAVDAVQMLILALLGHETAVDPRIRRLVEHLPGAFGLDDAVLTPMPVTDPASIRPWLAGIAADPATLRAWFRHLAGLLGGLPLDRDDPAIAGAGTAAEPFRATLVDLGGDIAVALTLGATRDAPPALLVGTEISVPLGGARLTAAATLASLPLAGDAPAGVLPAVRVTVSAPVAGGHVDGGATWDGRQVRPLLGLRAVTVGGTPRTMDLSSADAVVEAVTDQVAIAVRAATGEAGPGQSLLALAGLADPTGTVGWQHRLGAALFSGDPLAAIAGMHRAALDDDWAPLFAELAALAGLTAEPGGAGLPGAPWRAVITGNDDLTLELVAWDDRSPDTPAGAHQLRIGLRIGAVAGPLELTLTSEVLAFDLGPSATNARFSGAQRLRASVRELPALDAGDGSSVAAQAVVLTAGWRPDASLSAGVEIRDLAIGELDPVTVRLPPGPLDRTRPDLGLGLPEEAVPELVGLLAVRALRWWGTDSAAYALAGLLGLHADLPGLPSDWPRLLPGTAAGLLSALDDPRAALATHLRTVASGHSRTGEPFLPAALRWLSALLTGTAPTGPGAAPGPGPAVTGRGSDADPWAVPLLGADVDLLLWLDPPPAPGPSLVEAATDGETLLRRLAAAVDPPALRGRDPGRAGEALDRLDAWLAAGDGLVPYASATAVPAGWTVGTAATCPHDALPTDPAVVAQVVAQLRAWGAGPACPVLLIGGDAAGWSALIGVLEPGRDPDADTDPSVPAVCRVVPAPDARTAIGPVLAAAGAARLVLAGHGPAGVLARTIAAENPARVRGVVTLGAPHAGSSLLPLTDPEVADAARLARQLIPGDALSMLATRLDGGPFHNGRPAPPESFAGMPPTGAEPVPGLAIGSRVGSGLVRRLAAAHAQDPAAPAVAPSHLGVGVRVPAGTAPGRPGDLTVDGHVRVDALRVRVGTGPEPGRPAQRISVHAWAGRAGGWLIGGPGPGVAVRARLAELAVVAGRDATGGVALSTVAVAHEAGPAGITTDRAELADLADGELRDFLLRLGTAPGPLLAERMPDLLTLVLPALGARSTGDGGWELALPAGAVLAVTPGPWTVHARTTAAAGLPIEVDAALGLPGFAATVTAGVTVGGLRVRWSSASGTLSAALEPWLPEVVLLPAPPPAVLADAVLAALPGVLTSAAIALVVQPALGDGARALPLDRLISAPAAWLRRPAALGRTDGPGFDAAAVAELIDLVVTAIGGLPGGLTLTARAAAGDAVDLRLAGTVALDAATITIDLGLAAGPAGVRPSGLVGVGVTLPGDWGAVTVEAGLAAEGLVLAIVLDTGDRIDLLPRFGGLGAVAAAGARLLPRVLQELVDELRPPVGDPEGLLRAVLALATGLDVYADDSEGFTAPERAERLAAMLDPGWWAARAADPAQVAEIVAGMAGMFGPPPLLPLPAGQLRAEDGTVVWTVQPPGIGTVTVRLGWTAAGPVLTVGAAGVRIGPVVLDEFAAGVAPGPHADLTLHLEVDGLFAPIRPAVRAEVDAGRFAVAVLPLGADAAGDLSLTLAPVPALAATPEAALLLVERWGLPIAAELLLRAVDGAAPGGRPEPLLRRPLWQDGPTAEAVLVASGLVTTTAGGLRAARPLPEPGGAVLRALQAAATGIAIQVVPGQLEVALISEPATGGSRTGLRLRGRADIEAGELTVRLRFGDASWLTDADRGVTVWLLEPDPTPGAALPLRLTAALRVAGFGMLLSRTDGEPLTDGVVVLGAAGGLLFLEAEFLGADRAPAVTVGGLGAALEVQRAFVNVAGEDADSFIAKVLPPQLAAPFDLAVIYRDGALRIEGGGGEPGRLELAVPLDLDLAVIRITELLLALQTGTGGVSIEAALSGGADVGPVHAVVKRVGLIAAFRPEGPQLRFRPPDMVGLSIDSPSLRLGGFLLVDEPRGRYIGAIEISLLGKFEISAVGLITTKNPDGTPGFSLLFIISIIFPTPIALGYGFFFAGAGGMLGLNRSVDLDRLRDGLRTGAADSILFPTDVVRRADAIVRDLEAVFPVAPGQFLVGPMALITWGVPALISIKLGIILELGARVKVAVLGAVRAALPDPGSAVLDLKAAFLGTVDVAAGLLTFDAAIYDSYLGTGDLKFTFEGDIAVRLSWGAQPDFVMSVGGFHPTYKPAAHLRLPTMRRISISLLRDNPRLTLATYFAITSNTVQFGARLSFYLGVSGFSVEGDFGFDVLFQFSPFRFDAHAWAHLAVKAGGSVLLCLTLDFTLRGPAPWIARGTASFSILFFSVSVEFEATFGDTVLDTMPGIALLPRLIEELGRPENWTGALAAGATSVVSLLAVPSTVIDAGGSLTVSQRVLPLGTDVTLFGTSKPTDLRRLDLLGLDVGDDPAGSEPVTDAFSPAAFQEMSDSDKLRAPAFERRPAGARVTSGARLHTTHTVVRPAKFDLIVVDADDTTVTVARPLDAATLGRQVRGAAAARSPAAKRRRLDAETASVLAAGEPADAYAVTSLGDLRPLTATGGPATPGSPEARLPRSEAEQLAAALDNAGFDVQVVPAAQVEVPVR